MAQINNDDIIVFDTETTGLNLPSPANIDRQPFLTELYAVRLTKELEFISEFDSMFCPPIPIPEEITKITGIRQQDVDGQPTFIEKYDEIYELFCGVRYVVGHNVTFDLNIIKHELFRYDKEYNFNWPKDHVCTVEKSRHYFNKRLKLMQLHNHLFGIDFANAHRAKNDVQATFKCFREMIKRKDIVL